MRTIHQTLTVIMALGIAGVVRAQQDSAAVVQKRAGCYTLKLGRWSGTLPTNSPEAHTPPSWFRLDTEIVRPGSRLAVEPAQVVPGRMPASWAPLRGDSISLFWSTGYIGVRLRLAVRGDSLVGLATAFRDSHTPLDPPNATASVLATRTKCAPGTV